MGSVLSPSDPFVSCTVMRDQSCPGTCEPQGTAHPRWGIPKQKQLPQGRDCYSVISQRKAECPLREWLSRSLQNPDHQPAHACPASCTHSQPRPLFPFAVKSQEARQPLAALGPSVLSLWLRTAPFPPSSTAPLRCPSLISGEYRCQGFYPKALVITQKPMGRLTLSHDLAQM